MNVYKVILACERHYGNGHKERGIQPPRLFFAKNGDDAVKKAKKSVESFDPTLEGLELVLENVQ